MSASNTARVRHLGGLRLMSTHSSFAGEPCVEFELELDEILQGVDETAHFGPNGFEEGSFGLGDGENQVLLTEEELQLPAWILTALLRLSELVKAESIWYIASDSHVPEMLSVGAKVTESDYGSDISIYLVRPTNPDPDDIKDKSGWTKYIAGKMSQWAAELKPR